MKLSELIPQLRSVVEVTGVTEDSRRVRPGFVFVARSGTKTDGAEYVRQAIEKGAVAVVTGRSIDGCSVPQHVVDEPAFAASILAHRFHGDPTQSMSALAVTGTNGKTTTAYLIRHVLNHFDVRCGMMGTVEIDDGKNRWDSDMTTPAAVDVAKLLADMKANGCKACAMETSSHSLHQGRVAGVRFAGAAFTNLTGDHLDYHKTMDEYAAAKASLFESLSSDAVAAVNGGDPHSDRMIAKCDARVIRYGFTDDVDYRAMDVSITSAGSRFILRTPDGECEVGSKLIGRHNVENVLAAASLLGEVFGMTVHQLSAGLKSATGAPGRLQVVSAGQPFTVVVDYAHTDDALRNVLTALRPLTRGRLRVVFGCGGDRDATKRPRMASVAEQFADDIYVTSDNPRTESPATIIEQITAGFSSTARPVIEPDRRSAIRAAVAECRPGDVLLVAGKGHENYQIVGTTKHPFDDVEECRAAWNRAARPSEAIPA